MGKRIQAASGLEGNRMPVTRMRTEQGREMKLRTAIMLLDLMDTEDYVGDLQNKRPKFGSSSFTCCYGSQSSVHKLLQMTVKEEELNKSGSIDPPSHHAVSAVGEPLFADSVIEAMGELLFMFVFVTLG
ncbi:hypothetical protein Drorol1_Dr00018255 [Drosera rotundifolia]